MLLQACINGARRHWEHPAIPITAADIAADVRAVVSEGAEAVHVHVKDAAGADTLATEPLERVLAAVRDEAPRLPIGVTTGAWALPDPADRVAAIKSWKKLPDFASVNWHEEGAEEVGRALLEQGVDVEAGLWNEPAVEVWARSPLRNLCARVLVEIPDGPGAATTTAIARRLLTRVGRAIGDRMPVLLHGEGSSCWAALSDAARLGLPTRIGLEDTLVLPNGSPAPGNAALVSAALRLIELERS
ncbi:3-keto-5-aminohexanoate cleavage protein [Hoyosella sp. YIM 151337]|uniref:3-keto-5-aminohexanoate cleavage protein n=1 Tax=Hoyosella sp. YIM 151337 TaxID=2992742 RepID=UPI002236ABEF|nr:3-keto-5-aminohexanoate cleavage protein [Hoyosella sp. YIM 151337]MCW4353034.1 3-keto-5-aminohexanoate cleavage protein [Hoyosella sp. YIM 151337]